MANAKKNSPVEKIALQCTECKQKNYTTQKNRRNTAGKLELMKYCPFERKHTLHSRGTSGLVAPTVRALVSKTGCCTFESYLTRWCLGQEKEIPDV